MNITTNHPADASEGGGNISFVARLWLEPSPGGTPIWRGHIQHVQSGRYAYFEDLERMRGFLAGFTGVPFPLCKGTLGKS